jgi:hypothetical protein
MAADDLELNIGGFIWGNLGFGDRYEDSDDDAVGVQKAAVTVSPEYKNTRGVLVLGVDDLFNENQFSDGSDDDSNIEAKEAFVGIKFDLLGGSLDTTIGKQPLLFGLKPNGWVGDRSIQFGLEFGGADGVNVSGQVQSAFILDWSWGGDSGSSFGSSVGGDGSVSIRFGLFDTDDGDALAGTAITDNWFLQVRADDLFGTGLYGNAGYEQVDVAGSSEGIISVGAGWMIAMFDLSLEYQGLDQNAVAGVADDETQIIAEVTANISDSWNVYLDYATADEKDVDTTRFGTTWSYNDHTDFTAEYSKDKYSATGMDDDDSIDLRVAFNF